jgi:hypothetical protein
MPANANFDDIVTTTLRNRSGKLADNATRTTALLDRLRRRGKVKPATGGRTIVQELEVSLNTNGGWYAGYDTLSTVPFEPFTAAEYDWKQAYVPIVWSGLEKLKNMGESEVIDLVASRVKNGERSLYDLVAQASYSDGTGSGGTQLHGLGLMVTASHNNTVGGISQSANTFWANQANTVDFDAAVNLTSANPPGFLSEMNESAISCVRGSDRTDLIVTDATGYKRYLECLQPIQRVTSTEMAGYGFSALKYYGAGGEADVVLDNGYCPSKTMYFLNTDYIYLRPHTERNFVPFGGDRIPVNQDATVRFLGFVGNMCASNLSLQGILTDS